MSGLTFDLGMASGSGVVLLTALVAALISGAIGYGFSTLLVPVALLYYTSRVLNPGLVLAEIALNLLEGAATITRAHQLASYGVPVPAEAFAFSPRPLG